MKKRIISLLLVLITALGLFPNAAFAASSEEEALGEVNIFNGGYELSYLSINGTVRTQIYTYFKYTDATGTLKEVPAYCVNPNTAGVPQTVAVGESIQYIANEKSSDPKVVGIISNGYPHRSLGELKLDNKYQAYYATKMALWCYLLPNWNINNLKVAPGLTGSELDIGNRILAAAKDIYKRGTTYNYMLSPKMTATPDKSVAYPVTVDGKEYKQQVFTLWSETWVYDYDISVPFADPSEVPAGTRLVDENNNDITAVSAEWTGDGYGAKFKVLYPADSIKGQSGNVQLSFSASVAQYAAMYAICAEKDKYGNLQNYICDLDNNKFMELAAISSYADAPDDEEPGETRLKIVKLEEGTELPLEGAVFSVYDPEGKKVGSFSTGPDGTVTIPLTLEGHYTVTEEIPPKYHLLPNVRTQHAEVEYDKTATLTFWNAPYGSIRVQKLSDTGDALSGVTVQIKHIESGEVQSAKTNIGGVAVFDQLLPGGYEVQEVAGISGWIADTDTIQTVSVVAGKCSDATIINKELPGLRIIKYDQKAMTLMPNVSFEIFRDNVSLGIYKTDEFGEILLTELPQGSYRIEERHTGDDEHIVDTTPQYAELTAGMGIVERVFFNSKLPGIHLVKVDSSDLSKPIANAKFQIEAVDGSWGPEEFTTGQDGMIDLSKLPVGAYVVTELECPGYVIDEAQRIIQLDPDETAQFVFTNSKLPSLYLYKESADGTALAGVTFRLAKIEDGTHYLDRTTDRNGEICWEGLEPGVYSLVETATVNDHIIDLREHHVELFPGKDSTIVLQNNRRPNLTVWKHDADTGAPVPNTVFLVKAADGHSVDEIKTDSTGKATLENLLPGVYEISEKSVPSPYLQDADPQLVTLYPNRDRAVYFENHKKPTLMVNKVDSITGEPIQGAKFQVTYGSNNTTSGEINDLGTFFSDENGQFFIDLLRDGWYKVTELESAPGYSIKDPATQEVYIKGGESKVLTFENTPLSALIVWKYDSVTGEAVKNAVFQVKYLTGTSGTGGTTIGTFKTGPNGSFTVTGLKEGAYIVEELASDSGHVIDTAPQTAYISGKEQDVVQLYFGNSPKGGLLVKKIDSVTLKPLSDVEFLITTSDGAVVGNANGKYVTDSAGSILIDNIDPGMTLVVKETRAKDGYLLDDTPQTVKIKSGETVTLEFRNQPTSSLLIVKKDAVTGKPLSDVEFLVTDSDGGVIGSANGKFVTDSAGTIRIDGLTPGMTVIAKETRAKDGYLLDDAPQTAKIKANETVTLEFRNQPAGSLVIIKRDSLTGKPLQGVTFKVATSSGEFVPDENGKISSNGLYITDKDGKITINGVVGTLVVTETKSIPGYTIDPATQTQTVVVNPNDTQTLNFYNTPSTTLVIQKFIEGTDNEPLKGVTFLVTDSSGAVVGNSNGEYVTDEAGRIVITDLTPGLTVTAREIKTVEGYVLDGSPKSILIKEGEVQTLSFYNQKQGALVIQKKDSVTGKPLAGVEFLITTAEGEYVPDAYGHLSSNGLYTTDANGEIRIPGLVGTLVVKETKTIPGYSIDPATQTQTVTVNPNDTQTLTFYNAPIGGVEIIKVNEANKTQRIPNTTFEIRKMDGGLVDTVTTDKTGRVFISLDAGNYYAVEIEAGKGFKLDNTPIYFTVVDGKTTTKTISNQPFSGIIIHKIDAATRKGIYGVTFLLYDANKNPVGQFTSDQSGYVYIDNISAGKYFLRELENEGYVVDEQLKTVYVEAGGTTEITWENTAIRGQIQIIKKSADDNPINALPAGTLLEGAVFEICDKAGNVVDTIKTDRNGRAVSKLLPLSRYTIREVQAPAYYSINPTVMTAYLEYSGQIVTFEVEDNSVGTGVNIKKTGPAEVMPGQPIKYTITGVGNASTVPLQSFYWRDTLPAQVTLNKLVTGTYNQQLSYKVVYKTNLSGDTYLTLADNLSTTKNYVLEASPTALGLAANERVTEFMFVFGTVKAGFAQVETPYIHGTVAKGLSNGSSFVNMADVGGLYDGQWIMGVSRWVTSIYAKTNVTLPKTGY